MFRPQKVPIRILVTGTRGKSSLVRLLHEGLLACGVRTWGRITGVVPRELSPDGERAVRRTSPANVREMLWWLGQLPDAGVEALVMENSAVAPELQGAAARWLAPTLVVWTTLRSDHEDAWGPGLEGAAKALLKGIPERTPLAAGPGVLLPQVLSLLGPRRLSAPAEEAGEDGAAPDHRKENLALAVRALSLLNEGGAGLSLAAAERAMAGLKPDLADFRVTGEAPDLLALAFSANETESTERLFAETGWRPEETTLLYHHRPDRQSRLLTFLPWIESKPWRSAVFTRPGRPFFSLLPVPRLRWLDEVTDAESFRKWRAGRGKILGCGNVAGWPLDFLLKEAGLEPQRRGT